MGATSSSRPEEAATAQHSAEPPDAPTRQIVAAAGVSDRCASCGAVLASDQRYCVNCGERRGKARFSLAPGTQAVVEESTAVTSARRPRLSSGGTLVLGIGVLLLAMLVGVLIGHNNSPRQTAAAAPPAQIVTVGGGSGAAATPAAGTGSSAPTKISAAAQKARKHVPAKKVVITKQVAAKADAAANKVFGGATNLAPPTVQQGGACSNGQAGCQNGQFTGNFFGGG